MMAVGRGSPPGCTSGCGAVPAALRTGLLLLLLSGVCCSEILVPVRVSAVLGKNVTLSCQVEVGTNLSLTQSSWERHSPSGTTTLAVFNPQFGTSVVEVYKNRIHFVRPSVEDASIVLQGVSFSDIGLYTCKVATFPLGNSQASTVVDVMVEPKVYVSASSGPLVDGDVDSVVATCTAERARPPAEVFWESDLFGRSEKIDQDEPNGTITTQVRYIWAPTSHALSHILTCVVRHPALAIECRIPYVLDVQFAPDVIVVGFEEVWYVGQENARLDCRANANPFPYLFLWTRVDTVMPDGVEAVNGSLVFTRPLRRNDSGMYRCEVQNDVGLRSVDVHIWIGELPSTMTTPTTTTSPAALGSSGTSPTRSSTRVHTHLTSPTPASALTDGSVSTVVGGAVCGVLLLILLLGLGAMCYLWRLRRSIRGDYYTKQYLGPSDLQKEAQLDELPSVYSGDSDQDQDQDLKPNPDGDIIYPNYTTNGGGRGNSLLIGCTYYSDRHSPHVINPSGPPINGPALSNCGLCDDGADCEYVAHIDGSMISRREWYV